MKKFNILVTAISGDVSNSILKCLALSDFVDTLYGCDIYNYPCGFNKVKKCFKVPLAIEEKAYIKFLSDICLNEKIDLIIPTNEVEIRTICKNKSIFDSLNVKLLIHNENVYGYLFDKLNFSSLLKQLGLPYIDTCPINEYSKLLFGYPVIVKEKIGSGSKGLYLVNSDNDFNSIPRTSTQIVQRYVGDSESEFTVPVYSEDEGKNIYIIPFRRTLSKGGYTNFIEPVKQEYFDKIFDISKKIAVFIKLNGSIDLQMRYEDGEFYAFECNPRLSGTSHFRHLLGYHDVLWWVRAVLDCKETISFKIPLKNYVGVRELNEEIIWE